jgi:hypothetical protein
MVASALQIPSERRKGQRPSDVLLARVCAVIDLLVESGLSEEAATQAMARRMLAAGVSAPKQGGMQAAGSVCCSGWQRLLQWRSHLSDGGASEEVMCAYRSFADELDKLPVEDRLQRVLDDRLWNRRLAQRS